MSTPEPGRGPASRLTRRGFLLASTSAAIAVAAPVHGASEPRPMPRPQEKAALGGGGVFAEAVFEAGVFA